MTRSELKCEKLQTSNGPSWGESYLLDVESEESITMLENHWLQNLGSRSNFQSDRPGDITIQKKSEPLVGGQLHGFQTELGMNGSESDEIFYCSIDADLSLEEQWFKYPTPFSIDNIDHLEDVSSMFSEKDVKDMISNPVPSSGGITPSSISKQENGYTSIDEKLNVECHMKKDSFTLNADQTGNVGTCTQKRSRKPPQRYIDEISEPTNSIKRRGDICATKSSEKIRVKHHKILAVKSRDQKALPEELGMAIQVPFAPVFCCEIQKKQVPVATKVTKEPLPIAIKVKKGPRRHLGPKPKFKGDQPASSSSIMKFNQAVGPPHDQVMHSSSDDRLALVTVPLDECIRVLKSGKNLHSSSDDRLALVTVPSDEYIGVLKSGENGGRRKHHILWTMSEVKTLIDGVSQHGVGRWSRMKKELFLSSPHRTAVDLKDKWRNLLKAAYIQRENKRGEGKKRNLAWRPLPKSILRRVTELSIKYPYPRGHRSKC